MMTRRPLAFQWLMFVSCLVLSAQSANAVYNFADVTDLSGSRPFSFVNNDSTPSTPASATISATSVPVSFNFTVPTGLGTADRPATLTIITVGSPSTFDPSTGGGGPIDQPFDQPISQVTTLTLTENSTGKLLLGMTFTGDIVGDFFDVNAQLSGSDMNGRTVNFASDYLSFTPPGNSYALSLAALSEPFTVGLHGFLNSFTADITGQFSGNAAVPEPACVGLLTAITLALIRRTRRGING